MTTDQRGLIIRPVTGPGELDLLCRLPYVRNTELAGDLRSGSRRPEWMWVALRGDRLVARAAWWSRPGTTRPAIRLLVERLDLEWRSGTPVPEPTGHLTFRPAGDRAELVGLMAQVMHGTLDAQSQAELARMPAAAAAARQYDGELARYESPRDWWRIAEAPGGEPAGFVIPAHNGNDPIIAYIGVLPAQRGHGYVAEILAEGTRVLAGQGVPLIRANTDLANAPMARAFGRAGWATVAHQINMTWN